MKSKNKDTQLIVKGLISYLKKSGQLDQLAEISKIQQKKSWSMMTDVKTTIVSAIELTTSQKKNLEEIVTHKFDLDQPKITYKVNKSIIGGLVIKVGNKILDISLKHRLERLKESMLYA